MNTYTIRTDDGENLGNIETSADYMIVSNLYDIFCTSPEFEDEQGDIEEFIIYCQREEPEEYFSRFFIDDVIYPPQK